MRPPKLPLYDENAVARVVYLSLSPHPHITMSFAGRRRGNKVKKGVQFTVMVVGKPLRLQMPASAANARARLRSARVYALQYRVLHIY